MTLPVWIALGAVVLLLVGMDWFAGRIIQPAPKPVERTVPELGFTHEDLRIESGDHDLAAWLIKPPEAQPFEPLVLVAHGWSANYSTVLALAEPERLASCGASARARAETLDWPHHLRQILDIYRATAAARRGECADFGHFEVAPPANEP